MSESQGESASTSQNQTENALQTVSKNQGETVPETTSDSTEDGDWTVSKSKTATELEKQSDGTYTSDVTLSLPSKEETLDSDVVFVLDESDCYEQVYKDMWKLIQRLNDACKENPGAKLNVGVVFFRGCASTAWELQGYNPDDYDSFYQAVEAAKKDMIYKGSNLPSGLYAAKAMLESSSTPTSRQSMILISDGATYVYTHDQNPTTHYSRTPGYPDNLASMGGDFIEWEFKYGSPFVKPSSFVNGGDKTDWQNFLSEIAKKRTERDYVNDFDQVYTRTNAGKDMLRNTPKIDPNDFVINAEEAMYQSAEAFQAIVDSGVKCYTYYPYDLDVFTTFMKYLGSLGEGCGTDFDWIANNIIYLLDKGSVVKDVIGLGVDDQGNEYNFDFVNNAKKLKLKVGDKSYACTKIGENHYAFGEYDKETGCYPYELVYHPASYPETNGAQEYFEWIFNVALTNFSRAELTYQVVLTNPQTKPGTYTGLLTNRSANLHAVATDGRITDAEFEKPVVSYTVPGTDPDDPDAPDTPNNPNDSDKPDNPKEPDTPAEPSTPGTPVTTASLRSNVKTSDEGISFLGLGLALASGATLVGLAAYRRRTHA